MVNKIGPYSVTCILCYHSDQHGIHVFQMVKTIWICILYSHSDRATLPARIPNGRWSLGLAVRRWWSSHVCRYSHRSSILRGQWTWSGQHETHIGKRTQIKPFLLSTKQSGLWRERKLQKMHCGADHSWNRRWSYWLPSKTHIVDWNCRKYWKHKKNIDHFTKPMLMIEIVKYIKKYQKEWWPPETHIENQNCQKGKKLLQ